MFGTVGIACQGADAGNRACLEEGAVAAAEQGGMGLEEVQQPGKAAGREAVAAADPRACVESDSVVEVVPEEHLVRDRERLLGADVPAQAMRADFQEDLPARIFERVRDWR